MSYKQSLQFIAQPSGNWCIYFKTSPRKKRALPWTEWHYMFMQNYSWVLIFEIFEAQDLQWVLPVSTSLSMWFRIKALIGCDKEELCLDKQHTRCQLHFAQQKFRGRSAVSAQSLLRPQSRTGAAVCNNRAGKYRGLRCAGNDESGNNPLLSTTAQHRVVRLSPASKAVSCSLLN